MEKTLAMDLNKASKRAYGALYEHFLESNKATSFIVPLVVDDKNKTVLTVNAIQSCLYAFCVKTEKTWKLDFIANATEDAQNTSRVKLYSIDGNIEDTYELVPTSKANKKRESSKMTSEKAKAKKAEAEAKAEAEDLAWNREKAKAIMSFLNAKFKMNAREFSDIEGTIVKILEK